MVVDGYRTAFEARLSNRNRSRLLNALKTWLELLEAAGDERGAQACRGEIEKLPAAGG